MLIGDALTTITSLLVLHEVLNHWIIEPGNHFTVFSGINAIIHIFQSIRPSSLVQCVKRAMVYRYYKRLLSLKARWMKVKQRNKITIMCTWLYFTSNFSHKLLSVVDTCRSVSHLFMIRRLFQHGLVHNQIGSTYNICTCKSDISWRQTCLFWDRSSKLECRRLSGHQADSKTGVAG